jgi:hypothetical protein
MAPSGAPFGDFCRLHASLWQGGFGRRNLASRRQPGAGPKRLIETSWPGAREVSGSRRMCAHPDLTLARGALALTPELPPSLSPDPFDRIRRLVCVPLRHARWPLGSRLAQTIRGLNHPPSRHRRETVASGPEGLASDSRAPRRRFRFAGLARPGVSESGTGGVWHGLKPGG